MTPYNNNNNPTSAYSITNLKPGGTEITAQQLQQCRDLFSSAYGTWSSQGRHPHKPVTVSARRLQLDYLFDPKTCGVVVAKVDESDAGEGGSLVGQAFYVRYPYSVDDDDDDSKVEVIWITQLVVREDHRHKGVATSMIRKCLSLTTDNRDNRDDDDVWACGLVSCHPYAVKALETAAKSRCSRSLSAQHAVGLIQRSGIPYVRNCEPCISETKCALQTHFHVDHGVVDKVAGELEDWQLGSLEPGEEYFAFTYNLQEVQQQQGEGS